MVAIIPAVDLPEDPNPKTQRYGLFTAATGVEDLPVHARGGGIRYKDMTTVLPVGFEVTCEEAVLTFSDGCGAFVTGTPFAIQATMGTGSIGMPQDEIEKTLIARLLAGEQSVAEAIFSAGTFAQANSLANNLVAPTLLAGAASVRRGLGQLDEWLASVTSVRGIIHLPMVVSSYLDESGIIKEGGRLVTKAGNVISLGNYANLGPAGGGAAAGHIYAYACETTTVWRTPDKDIFVSPYVANLDLALPSARVQDMQNRIRAVARREYVVTHNNVFSCIDITIA